MPHLNRRRFLQAAGAGVSALALPVRAARAEDKPAGYNLPKLPYPYDALEPVLDARTMEIHHSKHHKTYVDNLNKALAGHPELMELSINDLMHNLQKVPKGILQAVINNGGGHFHHSIFWEMMAPEGKGGEPQGELARALASTFGTVDKFRETMTQAGLTRFGSGWAWLAWGKGKLRVVSTPNQDPVCLQGLEPLLCVDVWEHAYYLKYQNRRADYLKNWWKVVNWNDVAERFNQVQKGT